MANLRKGHCYTKLTRPFTRKSKFKKKGYIKTIPPHRIAKFDSGDLTREFERKIVLQAKTSYQIRHNAMESARQMVNRHLVKKFGAKGYRLKVNIYPHQILRENKMLSGARADRLQTGMAHAFGKSVGVAAVVKKGTTIFTVSVDNPHADFALEVLKKSIPRLPGKLRAVIVK